MWGVIDNQVVELADHRDHPGLVLVEVTTSARAVQPPAEVPSRYQSLRARADQLRDRAPRIRNIVIQDGPMAAFARAKGVLQRDWRAPEVQVDCASFVGRVRQGDDWASGTRVAGVSPTHPPDTELVLARPGLLLPVPDGVPSALASLVLYGAMAIFAARLAQQETTGAVGVVGRNALAYLCASALIADGASVALLARLSPDRSQLPAAEGATGARTPSSAKVWIDGRRFAAGMSYTADTVIGLQMSEAEVTRRWPSAERRYIADVHQMLTEPDRIVDMFYEDGPIDLPEWMHESYRQAFLSLAASGRAVTGYPLAPVEIMTAATPADFATALASARSGSGIMLTSFPAKSRTPRRRLTVGGPPSGVTRRVSVVGAGNWPRGDLLAGLRQIPDISLRGFCDRRPEALYRARQTLPFEYATTHYDELLADDATDMIVVTTYHGFHAVLAADALDAGKHCFVEKPPAVDDEQLRLLFGAARRSERFLYVGFNRRFAPATERLVRHLRELSGPTVLDVVVHGIPLPAKHWYYWPSNGNRIVSNCCHFIDYALHLTLGAQPVRIAAWPSELGRADSQITLTLAFAEGSTASISYTMRGSDRGSTYFQSYHVMKEDLTARIDDFERLDVWRGRRHVDRWQGHRPDAGHLGQMVAVANSLRHDGPPPVSLTTAELTARVVLAAARAAEERTIIELDLGVPAPGD